MLQSMGSQGVEHDWVIEQQQVCTIIKLILTSVKLILTSANMCMC